MHIENASRRAKYCPRCHAMNRLVAEACAHCGRRFHTGVAPAGEAPPPPADDALHRTQMFTLAPHRPRGDVRPERRVRPTGPLAYRLATLRHSPLLPGIAAAATALLAALGVAVLLMR